MIIVDCYNLLHTTMPPSLAGLDEARLCRLLASAGYDRGRAAVVCDGVVKPHTPAESGVDGVDLIYSGPQRSADDLIVQMVEGDSAPRRLTVVTNDRQIQKAAKRRRARVRSCESLIHDLAGHTHSRSGARAHGAESKPDAVSLTDQQVRQWLDEFGFDSREPSDAPRDWPLGEMVDESL